MNLGADTSYNRVFPTLSRDGCGMARREHSGRYVTRQLRQWFREEANLYYLGSMRIWVNAACSACAEGEIGMVKKSKHPSEYLNDLEEWQEHQYDPGHYVGGRLSPQLKHAAMGTQSGKILGATLFLIGVWSIVALALSTGQGSGFIMGIIFSGIMIATGLSLMLSKKR